MCGNFVELERILYRRREAWLLQTLWRRFFFHLGKIPRRLGGHGDCVDWCAARSVAILSPSPVFSKAVEVWIKGPIS